MFAESFRDIRKCLLPELEPVADWDERYRNNRTAMKEAIEKALKGRPTIKDLLKEDRRRPRHMYYSAEKGRWEF